MKEILIQIYTEYGQAITVALLAIIVRHFEKKGFVKKDKPKNPEQ